MHEGWGCIVYLHLFFHQTSQISCIVLTETTLYNNKKDLMQVLKTESIILKLPSGITQNTVQIIIYVSNTYI